MGERSLIPERAREDLLLRLEDGRDDVCLWEHTVRVHGLVERIVSFPELSGRPVNAAALSAATYYHDMGWALDYRRGLIGASQVRARPTSDAQREKAAAWLDQRLVGVLEDPIRTLAGDAVRQCNRRNTSLFEAQVLAEAENLDDIGPIAIWQEARQSVADGRGVEAAMEKWNRQGEYRFWEAKIKECFRFEFTRRLARHRLRIMSRCFQALGEQLRGEDLDELLPPGVRPPQHKPS